ncbi:MAG TPA: GAF domain-containing protein, partial [Calditrichaeota bacterium]|nr:GAF domain-containing protein [Calditrichota bacterium]
MNISFKPGESLLGQAVLEKQTIVVTEVPADYIQVRSGLGYAKPLNLLVVPLIIDENVVGVIELGSFKKFTPLQLKFIKEVSENIAIAIQSAQSRKRVKELLEK